MESRFHRGLRPRTNNATITSTLTRSLAGLVICLRVDTPAHAFCSWKTGFPRAQEFSAAVQVLQRTQESNQTHVYQNGHHPSLSPTLPGKPIVMTIARPPERPPPEFIPDFTREAYSHDKRTSTKTATTQASPRLY